MDLMNYCLESLLYTIGKLYAAMLFEKLGSWVEGSSTTAIFPSTWLINIGVLEKECWATAWMNLKSVFDTISSPWLWEKLKKDGSEPCLLYLIQQLYNDLSAPVRCRESGQLSGTFNLDKGVKHILVCILVPLLFNLYTNDLRSCLLKEVCHLPLRTKCKVPILLYADDSVVMSRSIVDLCQLIKTCKYYCNCEGFSINVVKFMEIYGV